MISLLNQFISGLFDLLMQPFELRSPWPGLIAASVLVSIVLLALFRVSSNAEEIRRTRNRLIARTLELLMFQHDLRVSLTACGRILRANAAYLLQFLRPMVVAVIPLALILVQMESWFDRRPLQTGEQTVLTVELDSSRPVLKESASIKLSDNLRLDSLPVRIPSRNELAWRITAIGDGDHWVDVTVGSVTERKSLAVGDRLVRLSSHRESIGVVRQLLAPSESPLDSADPFRRMQITYPARELLVGQKEVSWLVAGFALMMVFSLSLGRVFGVRIA
jgi:hypothetical protein